MSTFNWKLHRDHSLCGVVYSMARRGDGVAMRLLPISERQTLFVRRGLIQVCGPNGPEDGWCVVAGPGDMVQLDERSLTHEIVALVDETEVLGLYVYGRPVNLSQEDAEQGVVSSPLRYPLSAS